MSFILSVERRKDLTDHREDSTFSFDPSKIPVKQLDKSNKRRIDSRKGVLLSSYSRKKTRRRKRRGGVSAGGGGERTPSPSPKHSCTPLSDSLKLKLTNPSTNVPVDTLHPIECLKNHGEMSRQCSSNASDGTCRERGVGERESSLEDSGVVDDHDDGEAATEEAVPSPNVLHCLDQSSGNILTVQSKRKTKELRSALKCNGVNLKRPENLTVYTLPQDFNHVVTIDTLVDRNCDRCGDCCIDYQGWLRIQNSLYRIVRDPLFELLITVCILLNTVFLAMEHHGMSQNVKSALDIGNKVFTSIFTLECTMKLMALSKDFFNCGWNIFDLIIVSASLLDLSFELVDGLSVLRCLRLLRVLKLAQSWTTMKVLLSIIISTLGALGNLTFVLVIIIYIFAVIGMQLFSKDYTPERFAPDPVPRWNFNDFFHSFMMIFRILCGEWIEPLWDCMRAEKYEGPGTCFAIFLPALVMGNFMVLNLFLALLLNSFNSEELKSKKEEVGEESKLARSFERIRSIIRKRKRKDALENEQKLHLEDLVQKMVKQQHIMDMPSETEFNTNTEYSKGGSEDYPTNDFPGTRINIQPQNILNDQTDEQLQYNESISNTSYERNSIERNDVTSVLLEKNDSLSYDEKQDFQDDGQQFYNECPDQDPFHIIVESESGTLLKHDEFIQDGGKEELAPGERRSYEILQVQNLEQKKDTEDKSYFEPRVSLGEREDALYARIMREALSFAPTITAPHVELPPVDESPVKDFNIRDSPVVKNLIHRRSYALATRKESFEASEESKPATSISTVEANPSGKVKSWLTLVSYVDELTVGGKRDAEGKYIDGLGTFPGFGKQKQVKEPHDCFPQHCYQRIAYCDQCISTPCGQWWLQLRTKVLSVVDTPTFEWLVLVLIFASSITLCFEDIYLDENKFLKNILYWTNLGFCALFSIEMMLKWIALGFYKYFTSFWTVLDFVIVFVSVFSLLIEENENLKVLRSLRTLRALRPLRAISRWQGMRIVVNALMYAIPSIFNVLLVCLVFWLIFSIMGVQFFGGKFFKCVDEEGERLPPEIVKNKNECFRKNYTWVNSKITFDNVGNGYLALFQVATFEGWMEVMADAVDATGVDEQPQYEANLYAYCYFVIFIVCGSFFTLNLFIGVIIDNFNMLKKKYEGGVLEMFLTESQKHYYTAMKKLGRKKPQKVIKRPMNQFLAMFYDLSNSRRFEIAIFALIFLNMLTMGIEHFNQHHAIFFILEVSNAFFTTVFGLEAIVKIIGLRYHYFTVPWNLFDFLLVLASILGILMEDIMIDFPISPTLLRVVRVFRIGRILRLIKAAKGIRKLLFALVVSLPALFNIGALLALITFIYAIIGMSLFGHVKHQKALDDMVNFETFGRSMQLLFRLMTSAGWNDVLESLMVQPPECDLNYNGQPNGNCGQPLLAITYFTSFIIISYMIVINMYIAIILENFNQAHQEEEIGIVEDDLEMFYIRWSKFDPHATQFIRFGQLSDFIASLDPPLGIPKPNIVALVSFNLPIARGNKIHCLDILHALVKHVLGHVEETEDFKKLQDQMDIKFKKQFPTRKELEIVSSTRMWKRQDRAARIIQRAFRNYKHGKRNSSLQEGEDGTTQTSSPGGWQGKLSAFLHVHRGSRASSRKSSRASDASDLSELGTAWLNLPLLLLSGTQPNGEGEGSNSVKSDVSLPVTQETPELPLKQCSLDLPETGVCITVTEPSPDSGGLPIGAQTRRAAFRISSEIPRVVQALVHRESEEYEADS